MDLVPGTWYPHTKICAACDEIIGALVPVLQDASQISTAAVVACFLYGLIRRIRICHERLYKDAEQTTLQLFS